MLSSNNGRLYPQFPIVAAAAVVVKNERILMIKRAKDPNKGKWSIPGGGVELGETVEEAAKREVMEECNIEIEISKLLNVGNNIILDSENRVKYHFVPIHFLAQYKSGEVKIAPLEVADYRWALPDEICEMDIPPLFRSTLEILTSCH